MLTILNDTIIVDKSPRIHYEDKREVTITRYRRKRDLAYSVSNRAHFWHTLRSLQYLRCKYKWGASEVFWLIQRSSPCSTVIFFSKNETYEVSQSEDEKDMKGKIYDGECKSRQSVTVTRLYNDDSKNKRHFTKDYYIRVQSCKRLDLLTGHFW